jgi:hypothetical protein
MVKHVKNGTTFHLQLKNKKLFNSIARTHTTFRPPKPTSSPLYTSEPEFHWNPSPMTPNPQLKLHPYREMTGKINYKSLTSSPCYCTPLRPTNLAYRGGTQNIVYKKMAVSINTKTTKSANATANPNLVHKSNNAMTNQIARYHGPQPPSQFNTMVNSAASSSSNSTQSPKPKTQLHSTQLIKDGNAITVGADSAGVEQTQQDGHKTQFDCLVDNFTFVCHHGYGADISNFLGKLQVPTTKHIYHCFTCQVRFLDQKSYMTQSLNQDTVCEIHTASLVTQSHPPPFPVTPFHLAPAGTDPTIAHNFGSHPHPLPDVLNTTHALTPCSASGIHPHPLPDVLNTT